MGYYRRNSIFDSFTLNPLPYPVLLILAVALIFLSFSWYFSYESVVESAEQQMSWILFATPIALIILVRWLSSWDSADMFFPRPHGTNVGEPTAFLPRELTVGCGCLDCVASDSGAVSVYLS